MSPRKKDTVGGRKRTMTKGCKTWEPSHHKCSVTLNHNLASGYSIFPCSQNLSFPSLRFPVSPCQFCSSMRSLLVFHPMHVMNPEAISSFCMVCCFLGFFFPNSELWNHFSCLQKDHSQALGAARRSCIVIMSCSLHLNAAVLTPGDFDCKIYALFYPLTNFNLSFSLVTLLFTKHAFFFCWGFQQNALKWREITRPNNPFYRKINK